jgi:hypothetical protein
VCQAAAGGRFSVLLLDDGGALVIRLEVSGHGLQIVHGGSGLEDGAADCAGPILVCLKEKDGEPLRPQYQVREAKRGFLLPAGSVPAS